MKIKGKILIFFLIALLFCQPFRDIKIISVFPDNCTEKEANINANSLSSFFTISLYRQIINNHHDSFQKAYQRIKTIDWISRQTAFQKNIIISKSIYFYISGCITSVLNIYEIIFPFHYFW